MTDARDDAEDLQDEEVGSQEVADAKELSLKVIELTKALVFLNTRQDGHEARLAALREFHEQEVASISSWTAEMLERHRGRSSEICSRMTTQVEELERSYAQRVREAKSQVETAEESLRQKEQAQSGVVADWGERWRQRTQRVQQEAENLSRRLRDEVPLHDEQWLVKQVVAETQRKRIDMERRFEETCKELKSEQIQLMEALRQQREQRLVAEREALAQQRREAEVAAEEALAEAVQRQESSFEVERQNLEAAQQRSQACLNEVREEVSVAKAECEERQRLLDEMSRELQERKRQGQTMSKEADEVHSRKVRQEDEARALRRKKMSLERVLGLNASYQEGATERAVQNVTDDLQQNLQRLEQRRGELARKKRQLQERRALVLERQARSEQLAEDLAAERKRSDEMQRVLLRLEQGP